MCLNPVRVRRPDGSFIEVGCGHCSQCLRHYQDSWVARLNEEIKAWKPVYQDGSVLPPIIFFTLDYRDDKIPCKYLVITDIGVRVQDECPDDIPVFKFWSSRTMESPAEWIHRRKGMLARYYSACKFVWSTCERRPSRQDFLDGFYSYLGFSRYEFDCLDLPDFDPHWHSFGSSDVEYPVYDFQVLVDGVGCGTPLCAFEFHSVCKRDVQGCLKRVRRSLQYHLPGFFDDDFNPRLKDTWTDSQGFVHPFPSCHFTKNFKYFITSEYGPETFRPHYHGVMFGLTYDEFESSVAQDWKDNFGNCDFSVYRPELGGITYCAKYCAKGCYEHPLCCKDFIYPTGNEYHSDHFEISLESFGIDKALVAPTFHLSSKGLGCCYAFQSEVLEKFGVQLSEMVCDSSRGSVWKYVVSDGPELSSKAPAFDLSSLCGFSSAHLGTTTLDVIPTDEGDFYLKKYDTFHKTLLGESFISHESVVDLAFEERLAKIQYSRTYVHSKCRQGISVQAWHKLAEPTLFDPVVKTSALPLPRYYRQWLVSPLSSLLRQAAAKRLYPSVDAYEQALLESGRPADEVASLVKSYLVDQEIRNEIASARLRESSKRYIYDRKHPPRLM